jgi:hypothetical protein
MNTISIVTWRLEAGIISKQESSIARQRPINTFPPQPKHSRASTIPEPLLGNSPFNTSLNNKSILGRDILYVTRAEVT